MADPLSIASAAAGILAFGIQVTQTLVNFYNSYKHQDTEIGRTLESLQSVLGILQSLAAAIQNPQTGPGEQEMSQEIGNAIEKSEEIIRELQDEYAKFQKASDGGFENRIRTAGRRATYPFRISTLQKLQEDVGEIRENLEFALRVLQHKDSITTHEEISELKLLGERIDANQTSTAIRDWLKAPDATINHNSARTKCHTRTGLWLIKGDAFTAWLSKPNSFIWLNGFAGSGKSILCSTAIQHTLREKKHERGVGIGFFYFDFRDQNKQDDVGMLRALLLQLSGQLGECAQDLEQLYKSNALGTPPKEVLIAYLQRMVKRFNHVYVLLDALDESPRDDKREGVLKTIEEIRMWNLPGLHLLVTSRNEIDIRNSLNPASDQDIPMKNIEVDHDIAKFVDYQLNNNVAFRRWEAEYCKILSVLTERAQGVFRYVELQLNALKRARNRNKLYQCLDSLPRDLDETYGRVLGSISEDDVDDVRQILTMVCYSKKPLTVNELIHAHAVDLNEPPHLDFGRLLDIDGLQGICTGLIEITLDQDESDREVQIVRIAHFSVQEYLQSDRIKQQKAAIFALNPSDGNIEIAQVCLVYLLNPELSRAELKGKEIPQLPLAQYAAANWHHHYKAFDDQENKTEGLVLQLFKDRGGLFSTWVNLYDQNYDRGIASEPLMHSRDRTVPGPLYCASYLGLARISRELILTGVDVNALGGTLYGALQAAAYGGHESIVHMLLEEGADVNNRGNICRGILQLAPNEGHGTEAGVPPTDSTHKDFYSTAVQFASYHGHGAIVKMLLAHGADPNIRDGRHATALQVASYNGSEAIVQMLLAHGADVNLHRGREPTALQNASLKGHEVIVQMLLAHGADVNTHERTAKTALQFASATGHEAIVQMLLAHGADVNLHRGREPTALQLASARGHEAVVQILLDHRADVNARDEIYGTALQAASASGYKVIVQKLLAHGADINTRHEFYGRTPQQKASSEHRAAMTQTLLDHLSLGDVHGSSDREKLLAAAPNRDREAIGQMIEDHDHDYTSYYGKYASALQAASSRGHEAIVRMLLDHGADVNARHEELGTALQAAAAEGHESIVEILLAHGAIDDRHPEPAQGQRETEFCQEE